MTTVCKKCAGEVDRCPKCVPVRTNCWVGKRKIRFKSKMATTIKG